MKRIAKRWLAWVFSYGADGQAREPLLCTVRADRTGQLYVAFEVTELGAFGVAKYHSADQVTVIARAVGNGFINYEGRYAWPRQDSVRYVFTPVEGCRIAAVTAETMAGPIEVPAVAVQLGYYDLDLAQVPSSVDQVRLTAVFEPLPAEPEPGDPERVVRKLTTEVAEGSGAVYVNGQLSQGGPFEVWEHDTVWLAFQPSLPSQRVKAAEVIFEGAEAPVPLAVYGQSAVLRGMEADALVRVSFDSEMAPEPLAHTVTLSVAGGPDEPGGPDDPGKPDPGGPDGPGPGGTDPAVKVTVTPVVVPGADNRKHGSISPGTPVQVTKGDSLVFSLRPDAGWRVSRVEANGVVLAEAAISSIELRDIQADTELRVTFTQKTQADAVPPIGRPVHTLRSLAAAGKTLAQTGDTALVTFTGLAATACAAAGVAVLIAARRREREGQAR